MTDSHPKPGEADFGGLRRLEPISRVFGFDRGRPVDRYYIEKFLAHHAGDIQGHVLEIADDTYTRQFGGNRVTKSDVLHVAPENSTVTIVGDLTCAGQIPSNTFDCIICTQTLHLLYDFRAAMKNLHRILKPGGVLLATIPCISQISRDDMNRWGDFWRFTSLAARRMFEEFFPAANCTLQTHGNVLAATALLYGIAAEELGLEELNHDDPDYEITIAIKAVKDGL